MFSKNNNCPSCQSSNNASANFCTECGASLQEDSPYQPPQSDNMHTPSMVGELVYAGFWKRAIAYFLDMIVVYIIFIGIVFMSSSQISQPDSFSLLIILSFYLIWWLYYALQEGSSAQATLGKRALGIKVTDISGRPLSFSHAAGRQLAGAISSITFLIGYLLAGFTGKKQALHDMIAKCVVVNKNFGIHQIQAANQSPPAGMSIGGIIGIIFIVLIIPVGGIIAAIALPAYQDYTVRAKVHKAKTNAQQLQPLIVQYAEENNNWPQNVAQLNVNKNIIETENYFTQLTTDGTIVLTFKKPDMISGGNLYLTPQLTGIGSYEWKCQSDTIKKLYLPMDCRN